MVPVCVVFLYLVFGFLYLIYVFVSCLVSHVLFFHALMCPLSSPVYFPCWISMPSCVSCPLIVSCVLPSGTLCLLYGSLHVFSCAPPPRYLTWHPPSSLSSPVPRLVISVCVFSLCVSFTPCLVIVLVCPCQCSCSSSLFGMFWISFAFFFFHVWFELSILLCYFVSSLVATLHCCYAMIKQ